MIEKYRIVDVDSGEILANSLLTIEEADQMIHFLKLDHPKSRLEIERYMVSAVKPGFGRDPDLH
jgi:hypothetical protein